METHEFREAKQRISSELYEKIGRLPAVLAATDERLAEYVGAVCSDADGHCLWEQLAVGRFLRMLDKYDFDVAAVRKMYRFYEFLYFPGVRGMQRYRLTPVQCFQFAAIYGFRLPDGRRLTRTAVLFVPRKFSKTTSSAAFILWDMLYGEANAECYTGANSQDQAKKCFDVIRGCIRRLDPDGKRFIVNEQMIKPTRRNPRSAFAQCLTANARTKDGLNASTIVMDEYAQARDAALFNVLTTSMGIRREPLTVIITTASEVTEGPFRLMLDGFKSMLIGEADDDPTVFAHLFEPDVDDEEGDPATWRKVHPHLGVTVSEEFYRHEYERAKRDGAEAMLAFRTKLLNVFTRMEQSVWIGSETAQSVMKRIDIDSITGRPDAMVAFDLSVRDDFSAVTCGMYRGGGVYAYHTKYFMPERGLSGHANERLYRGWAESGWLTLLPGEVIDYRRIADYILSLDSRVRIVRIGYDSYKAKELLNILRSSGVGRRLSPVRQVYSEFTSPTESFEVGLRTGHIVLDENPITAWCFGNATLDEDKLGNRKPTKIARSRKIDGVVTILMAHKLFADSVRRPTV